MPALLALVDCNNFYASRERVFQPELRSKPVVVLSNNDGCCIARSNEAKAFGIEMGAPWHLHRERFARDGVIVRSSNHTFYGDMSARVMRVLAAFTPELEVYSVDEAFLGLSVFEHCLKAHARVLRATVSVSPKPSDAPSGLGPVEIRAATLGHGPEGLVAGDRFL